MPKVRAASIAIVALAGLTSLAAAAANGPGDRSSKLQPHSAKAAPSTSAKAPAPARTPAPAPASDQGVFVEEAIARGLVYYVPPENGYGRSAIFADLDGDGDPDIVAIGAEDTSVGLFENDGTGHFIDRSAGAPSLLEKAAATIAADFDNDGDLDLYMGRWLKRDRLWRNDGNFTFTDITEGSGLLDEAHGIGGPTVGDIDGDGRIDLCVGNYQGPTRVYRNTEDGFVEIGEAMGMALPQQVFYQSTFFDYDGDGDLDLYHSGDRGLLCRVTDFQNFLFRNDGGVFVDVTEESNTAACVMAMCIAVGDLNADGFDDIYVTNTPQGNALLVSNGDGTFDRAEFEAGVAVYQSGWGSIFLDLDQDGWIDLFVGNNGGTNAFFRGGPVWPLEDTAEPLGLHTTKTIWSNATADVDGDGDLDLLGVPYGDNLILEINHGVATGNHLKLDVLGPGRQQHGIGALVRVQSGGVWQRRQIIAGSSFRGQDHSVAHFGMADATSFEAIEVSWPDGASRTLGSAATNATWRIAPPSRLGDADNDGLRTVSDFLALLGCRTGDAPGSLVPGTGCEVLDFDGDFDVDDADLEALLAVFDEPLADCDGDGTADLLQIAAGAGDVNANGVLDTCETVPADRNVDFVVDGLDLSIVLDAWGTPAHDLNGDGTTGFADVLIVLMNWG